MMQNSLSYFREVTVASIFAFLTACSSPSSANQQNVPINSVEQAKQLLADYHGQPENFVLAVDYTKPLTLNSNEVPKDAAMAVISDMILAKGWMPNGFEEKEGIRYYRYVR